jgi:two-component system sensor histidine kinase UhpB
MLKQELLETLIPLDLVVDLPEGVALSSIRLDHMLSITREALSNVIRHAQAQNVQIKASLVDHRISLVVADNGLGLPTNLSPGFGLRNMRDRARLLGGDLNIYSEAGKGTTVTLNFPLQEN